MKRTMIKLFASSLSMLALSSWVHAGLISGIPEEKQKKPLSIKTIQGNPSTRYSVVETIITSNPTAKDDPKKLIQRSELGVVGPEGNAINRNVTLRVPQLGFDIKSNLTDIVPEVVGAVSPNPKIQVAAAAAGSLVEEGLAFASKELNKGYGNQQKEIRVLELLPSKYYAIDATNNTVVVKDNFKTDLPLYLQAQATIVPIANELNKAKAEYNRMLKTWQGLEKQQKFDEADKYVDQMDNYREKTIIPLEKRFLAAAQDVEKYSMHRVLIMNDPEGSDNSCGDGLHGRWNLLLYFYLGAKQTNKIKVSFCVPNTEKEQDLIVDLRKNQIVQDKDGQFKLQDGGIAFKSTDDKNISFPYDIEAGKVVWNEPESQRINWFREMVTAEDADLNSIMFPFDLLKIAKDIKAQEDAEGQKRWEKTRKAIKEMKDKGGLPKAGSSQLSDLAEEPSTAAKDDTTASGDTTSTASDDSKKDDKKSGGVLDALGTIGGVLVENKDKLIGAGKDIISGFGKKDEQKPAADTSKTISKTDYYAILGVEKNASQADITKAYRQLALTEHPDKKPGNTEKFQEILNAYDTLKDPEKRAKYDEQGNPK